MKKRLLLSAITLLMCTVAWCALPASGKYYRINNANQSGFAITENYRASTVICAGKGSNTMYEQLWLFTGSALQNVYTGRYIQSQGGASQQFRTGTSAATATFTNESDGHVKIKVGGNTLHSDAGKSIVKWEPENENSHWIFEEVTLTEEEVTAARKKYQEFEKTEREFNTRLTSLQNADYSALSTFFTSDACNQLKSSYASMSDADLKAAVAAAGLPEQIQNIAVKVKNKWSDEVDGSISAQFRVQDYQAYSAAEPWRWRQDDNRGLAASQINDMSNPTGIYSTGRDILFVFVEGEVPSGCELRLGTVQEGNGGWDRINYNNGPTLHSGINVIGAENEMYEYWMMYTVVNKSLKPADMPRLKIHIEGGHVLGYVNTQGLDEEATNAEYKKILLAANASAEATGADKRCLRLPVKGNYGMFNFQIMTYNRIWSDGSASLLANNPTNPATFETENWTSNYKQGFKIYKSIRFYDNVLHWEWSCMGFMKDIAEASAEHPIDHLFGGEDLYPTYCNNLAYTIMGTAGGNPYSSTGYTHMPGVGAVESSYNGERKDFDTWCVGHESGHNNQSTINLESSMESSNNFFSGVITYQYGYRHSRGENFALNQSYSDKNVPFGWRDIGMTHRMYYNLYLYYHRAGNKMDFYPTLFYNLRRSPIRMGGSGWYNGPEGNANSHHATTTWLHFYKKVCEAAQEDLTEYFRFWGFFVPVDKGYFGDYTSYYVTNTQEEIDEAIAWVKSHNWPENKSIMFIEDRISPLQRTDPWAKAGDMKPDNGGSMRDADYLHRTYGDLGMFSDYAPGADNKAGEYSYTISGTTVRMTGTGGVGFLVYDQEGNIVYRSNKLTFTLPDDVATMALTIKSINATNVEVEATNETGTEQYREALQNAITKAGSITTLSDETGTKMGYYTTEQIEALNALVEEGKTILTNNEEDKYWDQFRSITQEINRIKNEESVQTMTNTGLYTIQSNRSKTRYLTGSSTLSTATTKTDLQQWAFIATGTEGTYYLQNVKTRKFLGVNINSDSKIANWTVSGDDRSTAATFTLEKSGDGSFFLKTNDVPKGSTYINCDPSGNIAVWSADEGSKWNIVRVAEIEEYTNTDLRTLSATTDELINQICTYESKDTRISDVQTTDKEQPYYLSTNATTGVDETHTLDKILSGSNTYFSTVGTTVNAKRFITLDLGAGNEIQDLRFYYRTAPNMHTMKPAQITIQAGKSTSTLKPIATLTDLPVDGTKVESYTSPTISADQPMRIWRFRVDSNNNANPGSYPNFALAQFYFYHNMTTITPKEGYEDADLTAVSTAKGAIADITAALKGDTTPLGNYDLYMALKQAYDALSSITPTAIIGIEADQQGNAASQAIYDLSGRHVQQITRGGIYIVGGKKVLVK